MQEEIKSAPIPYSISVPAVEKLSQLCKPQELPMKQGEVMSQYIVRKEVYLNAFKDLQDHDRAYCYANIFSNMKFLSAKYPSQLTEKVMRYAPLE